MQLNSINNKKNATNSLHIKLFISLRNHKSGFVEGILETIRCSWQVQFAFWVEPILGAGSCFLIVYRWDIVVLLAKLRLLWRGLLVVIWLIVIVYRWCWGCWSAGVLLLLLASFSSESRIVPTFVIADGWEISFLKFDRFYWDVSTYLPSSYWSLVSCGSRICGSELWYWLCCEKKEYWKWAHKECKTLRQNLLPVQPVVVQVGRLADDHLWLGSHFSLPRKKLFSHYRLDQHIWGVIIR